MTFQVGDVNRNGQLLLRKTDRRSGNHYYAKIWELRCTECGLEYEANGCDFHLRRCPNDDGTRLPHGPYPNA